MPSDPIVIQGDLLNFEWTDSALDKQEGGGHYKDFAIQPIEFTCKNNLDFLQGNVVKYVCRHKNKNGILVDVCCHHWVCCLSEEFHQGEKYVS